MATAKEIIYSDIISPIYGLFSSQKLKTRDKNLAKLVEQNSNLQRFKEHRRNTKKFNKIVAYDILSSIQIDLADFSQLHTVNKGVNYLFCIIDVYSRYLWVYPIKNKSSKTTYEIFKNWLEEFEKKYNK